MASSSQEYTLYFTLGCHLCELAENVIHAIPCGGVTYKKVDIADIDSLLEAYGERIPVLKHDSTGLELGWPFDQEKLMQFIENISA
jgi:hypothetical protein